MAYQKRGRIEAHDATGFETDFIDFAAEYGDGYGSNVAHGDLSVQRAVEEGCRNTIASEHHGDIMATGFDKEPFMSKVQSRFMRAAEGRGEIPAGTSSRWAHKTDMKRLPERKG